MRRRSIVWWLVCVFVSVLAFMMSVTPHDAVTNLCVWLLGSCPSWVSKLQIPHFLPWILYLIVLVAALFATDGIYQVGRFLYRRRRRKGLAKFLVSGTELLQERITTDPQMAAWWRKTDEWHAQTQAFFRDNYGEVEAALFISERTPSESGVGQSYSVAPVPHRNAKLHLSAKLEAIRRMLNQRHYGGD
jgi:hypothetical protein